MLLSLPDVPLLSGSFALADRWLLWSRAQVYPDRVILAGWSFAGRHRRRIPMERIDHIDHDEGRLRLHLQSGERIALIIEEAARWARFIKVHREVRGE